MSNIFNHADQNLIKFLIGNKIDLVNERVVGKEQVIAKAKQFNMQYFETSAKTGEGVNEAVEALVRLIIGSKYTKEGGTDLNVDTKNEKNCC